MDESELRARIEPVAADPERAERHRRVYEVCVRTLLELNDLVPDGREWSLAVTHMEEVAVWANKGVARG